MCPAFLVGHSLLPWEKLLPQIQHYYLLFGLAVADADRFLSCACITLIIEVSFTDYTITTELEPVRNSLVCASPYILYLWFCIPCVISCNKMIVL